MLARRRMLGTTLFGGLVGATLPSTEPQSSQSMERQTMEIVDALKDIKKTLEVPLGSFTELAGIRQRQVDYLKATNKFPDFIDVGLDVWFAVHDWHVRHLQQMTLGRDPSGRYTIALLSTQLVMRPDLVPNFISVPYDNR